MLEQDIKGGRGDIPLLIMLCKRCDTIFERDGKSQRICRPCQTIAREKSYRERNNNYNKNTIRSIIKDYRIFK
jgi:hypothetical protein